MVDIPSDAGSRKPRRVFPVVCLTASIAVCALVWQLQPQQNARQLALRAQKSLRLTRYDVALDESLQAIHLGEDTAAMRLIAAEACLNLKRSDEALRYFRQIDDAQGKQALAARLSSGSLLLHRNQLADSEDQIRRALSIDPENVAAHRTMSECLGLQGRRWESVEHLRSVVRAGDIDIQTLCYLADTDRSVELTEEQLAAFVDSERPRCWLGAACVAIAYRRFERAEELIRKCVAADPSLVEAQARLGKQLLSSNSGQVMWDWNAGLPNHANQSPDIWFVRSQWCLQEKKHEQAALCLKKALEIFPDHAAANHQMALVLNLIGRPKLSEPFRERGRLLTRVATLANEVYMGDTRDGPLKEMAETMETMGRMSESMGWAVAAQYELQGVSWPVEFQQRLQTLSASPVTNKSAQAVASLESLRLPTAVWTPPAAAASEERTSTTATAATRFRDATAEVGVSFQYRNAEDLETSGRLMFEYTGGGVGVFDFDVDGWPDLYFTQAGDKPPFNNQSVHSDVLYRNQRGKRFSLCQVESGITDYGFGQGVAAGDLNNDGFPDLYVANIDGNQIFLNQGDGTFLNASEGSGVGHKSWSTSLAIADLNSDSVPDLYDVTFLSDEDIFERICEEDGVARSCAPTGFSAADDYLYLGNADGTFTDASDSSGIRAPDGDGLGILIADFGQTQKPSIFIANDGRANFYFQNTSSSEVPMFEERAVSQGLSFDRDGRAQACMGIASSDFDSDGTWDLFVTNFFNESNTIYLQYGGEIFGDNSQAAGIRETSLSMLGFGTQALDGDLDGHEDLLVGNGHVDDFEYKNIAYRMPLEFYQNLGSGTFSKASPELTGGVFTSPMLSRSMAVIDWNGDGRAEVAISRLDDAALVLENTTEGSGRFVAVRISGIDSSRDATTAILRASVAGSQVVRQFTAGDGYQSSNQKQVIFGLGDASMIDQLQMSWPSGRSQTFENIAADQTVMLREGDSEVWPLTH